MEISKQTNLTPIPYGRQHITQNDIDAVTNVLVSDYLTQGPVVGKFEKAFAKYVGSKYALSVSNGTAALHLAVLALGIKPGQKVITTPITFVASANCVLYAGGEVDFVDIDPDTFLIDLDHLEKKLSKSSPGEYAGIIPVDFTGLAVNLERLRKIADNYGLWVLEDACHAPGGSFINSKGETIYCGDCRYADAAIFSFHPVKHIAAGEGGMVTTNNKVVKEKIEILRTHGITKNNLHFQNSIDLAIGSEFPNLDLNNEHYPGWYYEMQELGFNYRLTDIQSALGLSQLQRANEGLNSRRKISNTYFDALSGHDDVILQRISQRERKCHAYHLYIIKARNRDQLYEYLREKKIFTQIHYFPVHLMPFYKQFGWKMGNMQNAESYYKQCISLPMYPTLTEEQQSYVIDNIKTFYN